MNLTDFAVVSDQDTETQTPETSTDDTTVSTEVDNRSLTPAVQQIVENFSKLSPQEQAQKIANLEGNTARPDQREAAKSIREMFDIKDVVTQSDSDKAGELQKKIDELKALEESQTQNQDKYAQVVERLDREERNGHIKQFLLNNKIDADVDNVLEDKQFWSSFLSTKDSNLDVGKRVKLAMLESYSVDRTWIEKQKNAQATGGMAQGGTTAVQKKKLGIKDMKDMSLSDYEAAKGLPISDVSKM